MPNPPSDWPGFLTPLPELLAWLEQEAKRRLPEGLAVFRHQLSLRWLVLAELGHPAPPAPGIALSLFPHTSHMPLELPDIEKVSAQVHEAWLTSKRAQGVTSRLSEGGEELMVPYAQLSEPAKDLDRGTVRAVYAALAQLSEPAA